MMQFASWMGFARATWVYKGEQYQQGHPAIVDTFKARCVQSLERDGFVLASGVRVSIEGDSYRLEAEVARVRRG